MAQKSDGLNRKWVAIPVKGLPQGIVGPLKRAKLLKKDSKDLFFRDYDYRGQIWREVLGHAQFYEKIDERHELWPDYLLHKRLGMIDNGVFLEEGTPAFNKAEIKTEIAYHAAVFKKNRAYLKYLRSLKTNCKTFSRKKEWVIEKGSPFGCGGSWIEDDIERLHMIHEDTRNGV